MWCSEHEISNQTRCPACHHDLNPDEIDIKVELRDIRWSLKSEEVIAIVSHFDDVEVFITEYPGDSFPPGISSVDTRFLVLEIGGELYKNIQEVSDEYDARKIFTQSEG